ncbi:transglutaminase-like putative cysteine protease [Compostimonas suwonensis]|uniref:Transglutaminase-like putative cysteine protease n=2 Tax=Compostimonas suwonensis TaxID=1048394 RepID=A0A2M9BUI5_9MICO|nr:transglutaminase-like putative cysteine protease [Compostimonas suwonensis]
MRTVSCRLDLLLESSAELILSIAVRRDEGVVAERIEVTDGERPIAWRELVTANGSRLQLLDAGAGRVRVAYEATVGGTAEHTARQVGDAAELELLEYLRPSRYCESDLLLPTAAAEFAGVTGPPLLLAVGEWVHARLAYESGSTGSTDGAADVLLARRGVCRDFAHLTIALLRALDVPARYLSVYAPGLSPMDFHAVAEAYVDGAWHVVDSTRLAPRQSLVRIATGRDAADAAFLTHQGGALTLVGLEVMATVAGELPRDDHGTA